MLIFRHVRIESEIGIFLLCVCVFFSSTEPNTAVLSIRKLNTDIWNGQNEATFSHLENRISQHFYDMASIDQFFK